jgi:hypothetical protein
VLGQIAPRKAQAALQTLVALAVDLVKIIAEQVQQVAQGL